MRQLGVGSQGGAEATAIFHPILHDEWTASSLNEPLARIKSRRVKLLWNDRVESSALGGVSVSPQAHGQQRRGNIETYLMLNKRTPAMPKDQRYVDGPLP